MFASVLMAATDKFVVALVLSIVTTLLLVALVVLGVLAARPAMKQNKAEKQAEGEKAVKAAEELEKQREEEKIADEKASAQQLAALERAREISRKVEEAKENLARGVVEESEPYAEQSETPTENAVEGSAPIQVASDKDEPEIKEEESREEESKAATEENQSDAEEAVAEVSEKIGEMEEPSLETAATVAAAIEEEPHPITEESEKSLKLPFGVRPERVVNPYSLSFKAKLIQSGAEAQSYFGEIEDLFASFVDVRRTESWSKVRFKIKRDTLAIMSFRGSSLCIALAVDPSGRNLRGRCARNMSGRRGFANTPLFIKLKSERALSSAKEFINELMASYDSERVYIDVRDYRLPYEDSESLASRGLARLKPTDKQ